MYICSMCKKEFEGEHSLKNATGIYCQICREIILERVKIGTKNRRQTIGGICLWCGTIINLQTCATGKENENVCGECVRGRDWLLKVIRYSDRPSKYVTKKEEREKPLREARDAAKLITNQQVPLSILNKNNDEKWSERIEKLESLMDRLSKQLGV